MRSRDFLPGRLSFSLLAALVILAVLPARTRASAPHRNTPVTATSPTITFGQELGNIRPFSVTIAGNGSIKSTGPIHLNGATATVSKDAVAGLVVLAQAEGFRALPSFTACPGALPDIAARYVSIRTPTWRHRASVRGNCVGGLAQLFAVLMDTTHASF
jgi:hypothetical protein